VHTTSKWPMMLDYMFLRDDVIEDY
jgi:hypothetical protein